MTGRGSALLLGALLLAACSPQEEEKAGAEPGPTLHEMMTKRIDPDADAIWAIGNAALNDHATIDPAKMNDKNWTDLGAAAERMAGHARQLAALDPVVVTRPGVKIADEGTPGAPSPADIQGHIKRDGDVYRSLAELLANHSDQLAKAAKGKDAATAGRLISELDGVCEQCHLEFWYPEQKAFVEAYLANQNGNAQ